jgi:hypothetical protein
MRYTRNSYTIFVREHHGTRLFRSPSCTRENCRRGMIMTLWIHLKWIGLVYNDLLREYVELSINARNLLTNVYGVFM